MKVPLQTILCLLLGLLTPRWPHQLHEKQLIKALTAVVPFSRSFHSLTYNCVESGVSPLFFSLALLQNYSVDCNKINNTLVFPNLRNVVDNGYCCNMTPRDRRLDALQPENTSTVTFALWCCEIVKYSLFRNLHEWGFKLVKRKKGGGNHICLVEHSDWICTLCTFHHPIVFFFFFFISVW